MFKLFLIFALLAFNISLASCKYLQGLLLLNEGEPVAFASILSLDFIKTGTVSREDGSFEINFPEKRDEYKIFITAANIQDTVISLKPQNNKSIIYLNQSVIILDEVKVYSKRNNRIKTIRWWENQTLEGQKLYGSFDNHSFKPSLFQVASSGLLYGNSFELNKESILLEVGMYVWQADSLPQRLIIRLFQGELPKKYGANQPLSNLVELTNKPFILTIKKSEYAKIDLRNYNINIEKGNVFVAVTPEIKINEKAELPIISVGKTDKRIGMFILNSDHYTVIHPRIHAFYIGVKYLEVEKSFVKKVLNKIFKS